MTSQRLQEREQQSGRRRGDEHDKSVFCHRDSQLLVFSSVTASVLIGSDFWHMRRWTRNRDGETELTCCMLRWYVLQLFRQMPDTRHLTHLHLDIFL